MSEIAKKKYHFHKRMFSELHRVETDDNLKYFMEEYILSKAPLNKSLEEFRSFLRQKLSKGPWGNGGSTTEDKSKAINKLMEDEENMDFMARLWS